MKVSVPHTTRTQSDIYDALLRLQAQISQSVELPTFRQTHWSSVRSIVDLGCGNGDYIHALAHALPNVSFTGVDTDKELISRAREYHSSDRLTFVEGSLDALGESFNCDMLLARLAMMYLPDRSVVSRWATEHVRTGAVLIDADDDLFFVKPSLPLFLEALAKIQQRADSLGGKRNLKEETEALWLDAGFVLKSRSSIVVHSELPGGRELMHHLMALNAELAVGAPLEPPLLEEIFSWSIGRESYLQYGLMVHEFVRL